MMELTSITVWGWFVLAVVLIGLEVLLPGIFFVWLGLAAGVTGFVSLFAAMDWPYSVLLFALLGVVLALVGRRIAARVDAGDREQPFLNRRADALVGQSFVLTEPLINGEGRIRIGDTVWHLRGSDAGTGTRVKVVRIDGGKLVVE